MLALAFSVAVELSQLYHASWIDSIRHTTLGGLILGFDFVWSDLACYALGVGLGVSGEILGGIGECRPPGLDLAVISVQQSRRSDAQQDR